MIAHHIHDALAQVRDLQRKILEKQRFKGYSGRARAISGTVALLTAGIMSSSSYPKIVSAHIYGWGIVFLLGFLLNYGALIHWFLFDPKVKRNVQKLRPALDALPALFVGAVLTLVLIKINQVNLLFGVWMCLYGVASFATRQVLPNFYWTIGAFYTSCGTIYLLTPDTSFLHPWPMGMVFFVGEWAGGVILHYDEKLRISLKDFLLIFSQTKKDNRYVP